MSESSYSLPSHCLAAVGGVVTVCALNYGGPLPELHERSHAVVARLLTTSIPTVHVNAWGNWRHVMNAEGVRAKLYQVGMVLLGEYGGGGRTSFDPSELSRLGRPLGRLGSLAAIALAGPASTLLVHSATLVAGVSVRKKRPLLSTFLISLALVSHLVECDYPLHYWRRLRGGLAENLGDVVSPGNDFAIIADCLSKSWGVPRLDVAYWVGFVWTASLPCVGLWASRDRRDRPSALESLALTCAAGLLAVFARRLIAKSGLSFVVHSSAIVVGAWQGKTRPRLGEFLVAFAMIGHLLVRRPELNMELMSVPLIGMGASLWFADDEVDGQPI